MSRKMKSYQDYLDKYRELCRKSNHCKPEDFDMVMHEIEQLENENPEYCEIRLEILADELTENNAW